MKYQPYRDEPYQRECEDRYAPIYELAKKFNRSFSVLDVGANYGWFGHRLVNDFPNCVYFGIDNKPIDPHPRIHHMPCHVAGEGLRVMAECEQFDIVLGLSVLHHFPDYDKVYEAMRNLGWWSFFEIPGHDDIHALAPDRHQGIIKLFEGEVPVKWFPSHVSDSWRPMYALENTPYLKRQSMDADHRRAPKNRTYNLPKWDFDECRIEILRPSTQDERRDYIPGMNAWNFRALKGRCEVQFDENHPDPCPWNCIIGDGIHPIDYSDKAPVTRPKHKIRSG
jgi:hypothetical protein